MTHPTVQPLPALDVLQRAIDRVTATQHDAIRAAATLGATALAGDGILQAFGTGHSKAFAMELTGRAGGLIPTNPGIFGIAVSDQNELIVIDRNEYTLLKYALSP